MSTQPVLMNIQNPKKTWSTKRKKKAITKRWYKKGPSKSARRRKKTIHSRGKTKSNSRKQLDDLGGKTPNSSAKTQLNSSRKTQSISSGKTHSNSRTELDELYKSFISCEPNCTICDKYILDFSQHLKLIHTHTPIPSCTAENHENSDGFDSDSNDSDDVPLQFYVTKKLIKAKAGMRKINTTRKRKLINKVSRETETAADLGIPLNSDASHISEKQSDETFLSNINSDEYSYPPEKKLKSKCGRSFRVRKKIDYAEILNRNAEVENECESDKITLKSGESFSHIIILENIKHEPDDSDPEIVIPEGLDFDDMALSDLDQIKHSSPDPYTTEDLGHLSQHVVAGSIDQVDTADSDERHVDQDENVVDENFLDNRDPAYIPKKEDNDESDSAEDDGDNEDYTQNPDESDNNDEGSVSQRQMHHCDHCTRKYLRLHELKRHLQKCHDDLIEKPFVCTHCTEDVRFCTSIKLNTHVRTVHPGQKSFVCTICTKGFDVKYKLDDHVTKHTGEKPFECPHCEKKFRTKKALTTHVIIHTVGKQFHCDYEQCGKSYCNESQLNQHKMTHSSEKPYMCDQCSKFFRSITQLNTHMFMHGERSKICEHCGKGFKTVRHLKRHVMIHTEEKPHQCELCGRFFRLRQTLRFHLKCTHGIDGSVPPPE